MTEPARIVEIVVVKRPVPLFLEPYLIAHEVDAPCLSVCPVEKQFVERYRHFDEPSVVRPARSNGPFAIPSGFARAAGSPFPSIVFRPGRVCHETVTRPVIMKRIDLYLHKVVPKHLAPVVPPFICAQTFHQLFKTFKRKVQMRVVVCGSYNRLLCTRFERPFVVQCSCAVRGTPT